MREVCYARVSVTYYYFMSLSCPVPLLPSAPLGPASPDAPLSPDGPTLPCAPLSPVGPLAPSRPVERIQVYNIINYKLLVWLLR